MASIKKIYHNGTAYNIDGGVTSVNGQTGAVTVQPTLESGTNIKTVNGNSLLGSGDLEVGGITKIFTISSSSDLTTAQAAYDWYVNGGYPIIKNGNGLYCPYLIGSTSMQFSRVKCGEGKPNQSGTYPLGDFLDAEKYKFTISSGVVTAGDFSRSVINITDTAPQLGNAGTIYLVI